MATAGNISTKTVIGTLSLANIATAAVYSDCESMMRKLKMRSLGKCSWSWMMRDGRNARDAILDSSPVMKGYGRTDAIGVVDKSFEFHQAAKGASDNLTVAAQLRRTPIGHMRTRIIEERRVLYRS